jgi:CBS domain-containing protein
MSSPVETIAPTASVQKAAQQMQAKDVSALLVRTSTAGIITSTDVVTAVADGNDLSSMEVSEVMTAAIETVTPELDLDEAAAMMTTYDIKHLPVVDDDYIGMLSSSDMTAVLT